MLGGSIRGCCRFWENYSCISIKIFTNHYLFISSSVSLLESIVKLRLFGKSRFLVSASSDATINIFDLEAKERVYTKQTLHDSKG